MKREVLYSVIIFVLFFIIAESCARVYALIVKPQPIDYGQGFNKDSLVFVVDEKDRSRVKTNPEKLFNFQDQSFTISKGEGTLRVAVLGGSSVNFLQQHFKLMEREIVKSLPTYRRVEIINAGGHSYGSHRLVLVLSEVLHYQPDVVVIDSGHNEFEEVEQLHLVRGYVLDRFFSYSAFYRTMKDAYIKCEIGILGREHDQRILSTSRPNVARAWNYQFTKKDVVERMDNFEINLQTMIDMCRNRNVRVVVNTIPSNLISPCLPSAEIEEYRRLDPLFAVGKYAEARNLGKEILRNTVGRHQSSDLENNIIKMVAKRNHLPLVDIEAVVTDAEPHHIPGETLFRDHCHLNFEGNNIWMATMNSAIIALSSGGRANQSALAKYFDNVS